MKKRNLSRERVALEWAISTVYDGGLSGFATGGDAVIRCQCGRGYPHWWVPSKLASPRSVYLSSVVPRPRFLKPGAEVPLLLDEINRPLVMNLRADAAAVCVSCRRMRWRKCWCRWAAGIALKERSHRGIDERAAVSHCCGAASVARADPLTPRVRSVRGSGRHSE